MQFVNADFEGFAELFAGAWLDEDVAFPERLDRSQLDFSLDSLHVVDRYLTFLHENLPEQMGREWVNVVLWGGAYVGEVIRRHASRNYDWVAFEDWLSEHPEQVHFLGTEKSLELCAFLTPGGGGLTLPLNKVYKFLFEGPSESVWFYATAEVRSS
jgi:hypothetical protein